MKKMFSDYKKIVFTLTALIAVVGYGFVVFAAAPNGGYTPGSTLDPDCAPGDIDCVVALVAGGTGTPAGSDTQIQYNNAGAFGADSGFTRTSTGVTNISSTFGSSTGQFSISDNLFGAGIKGIATNFSVGSNNYTEAVYDIGGGPRKIFEMLYSDTRKSEIILEPSQIYLSSELPTPENSKLSLNGNYVTLEMSHTDQSAVSFTGSGLDDLLVGGTFSGTGTTNYVVSIDGINKDYVIFQTSSISGSGFQVGETITSTSGGSATIDAVNVNSNNSYENLILSSITGTFLQFDTITGSTSGTTATLDADLSQQDTYTWTDGTTTVSNVICKTFGSTLISNNVLLNFDTGIGHTLSDSWTWTSSNVNQNVLDFSNNDYNFKSTFSTDTFGYQITDNLLGLGVKGSANTWTSTAGDLGISGLSYIGDTTVNFTNIIFYSDGHTSALELGKNRSRFGAGGGGLAFEISSYDDNFQVVGTNSGIEYGISQSAGVVTLGNLTGGNNTKITINDVTQAINFNGQYSFPFADGTANQVLTTDGAGQLSWTTVSGGSSLPTQTGHNGEYLTTDGTTASWTTIAGGGILGIGTINSQTRSANGATISGNSLILQTSNRVLPGLLVGETDSTGVTLGVGAGVGADTTNSVFIGVNAGNAASGASGVNAIGNLAGYQASAATGANFIGRYAGYQATYSSDSSFIGRGAGMFATQADHSIFIGANTGNAASAARFSVFLGEDTGRNATNAEQSIFIGYDAGFGATNASSSVFIGTLAGKNAPNAPASIFIGNQAGYNDTVDTTTGNSAILIGNATSTGGYGNSIALGTNAVNTATNQLMIGSVVRPINEVVIKGSGTCSIVSTGISCSSDERLKTNITDLENNTLDTITNIRTVRYNWNRDPSGEKIIGFLAQDLEQYYPELVRTDSDGFKMVNYAQMTPILVQAIREMNLNVIELTNNERSNTWRDSLIAWLGDVSNGIGNMYVQVLHANRGEFSDVQTDVICIGQTCVTETQLQQLLNQNNVNITPAPLPVEPIPTNNEGIDTGDSITETSVDIHSTGEPSGSIPESTVDTGSEISIDTIQ